jgi:hypothetical protein
MSPLDPFVIAVPMSHGQIVAVAISMWHMACAIAGVPCPVCARSTNQAPNHGALEAADAAGLPMRRGLTGTPIAIGNRFGAGAYPQYEVTKITKTDRGMRSSLKD